MNSAAVLLDRIIARHTEKLKHWYDLLREIMPDYFFRTFSAARIEEIMPLLFNIDSQAGIQKITRDDCVILVYLKNKEHNLLTTSKLMMEYNVSNALIHESKQKIVINNVPQTLVIEYYNVLDGSPVTAEPLFSRKELAAAYRTLGSKPDARFNEVYDRINWDAVADLTAEKLAERLRHVLDVQDCDYPVITIEKYNKNEFRLTFARTNSQAKGVYYRVVDTLNLYGFNINRAYARQITHQDDVTAFERMPVTITTFYLDSKGITPESRKIKDLLWQMQHITWCNMHDLLHKELVERSHWSVADANLMRAAATFIHSQLAFVDRNVYHHPDIWRFMALYEPILRDTLELFRNNHCTGMNGGKRRAATLSAKIAKAINAVNTGMNEKDTQIKTVLNSLLNFIQCIRKTNFFVENKACLGFRLNPEFIDYYSHICPGYADSFPTDRPCGIFFFYRENNLSFQVRFSEIARGGWRTVVPKTAENALERNDSFEFAQDELFREVYVLAHTQHMKNKDIYEGGAKMISLLHLDGMAFLPALYLAQRTTCAAFLQLINYGKNGKLKNAGIVDLLGGKEIIEIGPDENMHDVMIDWIGNYAERQGYTLGAGLISGKPGRGINHKEYGVTSFGVHQYLLRVLTELGIDPEKDQFSIKISGGPIGDVAGNEMNLLLHKKADGSWLYPQLRIVAVTDGPAAAYDPAGLDRETLQTLLIKKNLDSFPPEKLSGDGAYVIYSAAVTEDGAEKHRMICRNNNRLTEKLISRDDYMRVFQDNLDHYADVFIPCGGRPSTIDGKNWRKFVPDGKVSSRAIVEGANSFITPAARNFLQEAGILIVKDASANKCGVITSSYEILSGLMLTEEEFRAVKPELVKEIMDKLEQSSRLEAEWLFAQYKLSPGRKLTDLTEQLSRNINTKNAQILEYLEQHPELVQDKIILEHLPMIFRKKFQDRVRRIPMEYRKAIVAVELASRIVYYHSDNLAEQIKAVL